MLPKQVALIPSEENPLRFSSAFQASLWQESQLWNNLTIVRGTSDRRGGLSHFCAPLQQSVQELNFPKSKSFITFKHWTSPFFLANARDPLQCSRRAMFLFVCGGIVERAGLVKHNNGPLICMSHHPSIHSFLHIVPRLFNKSSKKPTHSLYKYININK